MMFTTATEMENELRRQLASMEPEDVYANLEPVAARLRAMGMYDLARDLSADNTDNRQGDVLARLYSCFGVSLYGSVVIENLTPELIEFECIYGLNDPLTNEPGREVSFTVRDAIGRFPVNLTPDNISADFSVNTKDGGISCTVKSCEYDRLCNGTHVTLDVRVSAECFQTEGIFVMHINVRVGKTDSALVNGTVKFVVKNSFPDFSLDDITGKFSASKPLPPRARSERGHRKQNKTGKKEIITDKRIIQTKQRNVRIGFDKQGQGEPMVLCSNGAFKAGVPSRSAVNISFRLPIYKAMERKLELIGIKTRIPPETSVWVEWEDFVMIYNVQYKGFLID